MKKSCNCDCGELGWDVKYLKHDVGFQSRTSYMSPDYKPIIRRVEELEEKIQAIMTHLDIQIVKERNVVVPNKEVK